MWRLYKSLKWFWHAIILTVILGIGVNFLFGSLDDNVVFYLKWNNYSISIGFIILFIILVEITIWSGISYKKYAFRQMLSKPYVETRASRNRRFMIDKVRSNWINGVLNRSIHLDNLIHLNFSERLDLVERDWDIIVQLETHPEQQVKTWHLNYRRVR